MQPKTPLLQQYFKAKESHPEALMAMRVGDFYEFYGEDAETVAGALSITLTGKEDGSNGRVPMAGVPFHAVEKYLAQLVRQGFKVALCDQVEDPKMAKGLVRREVRRVVTAGTVLEDSMLDASANNFLAAIVVQDGKAGLALLEPTTGVFEVTELQGDKAVDRLLQEIHRARPAELLVPQNEDSIAELLQETLRLPITRQSPSPFERAERAIATQYGVTSLKAFDCHDKEAAVQAAEMILAYAKETHLNLDHLRPLSTYSTEDFMQLDPATRRSLELTHALGDTGHQHTLLSVIDRTATRMGTRKLTRWITQPLLDADRIGERQDAITTLIDQPLARHDLIKALKRVRDIERLVSRIISGAENPRDLGGLKESLQALPDVMAPMQKLAKGRLHYLRLGLGRHSALCQKLADALQPELPTHLREGGVFKDGFDKALDALRNMSRDGKSFMAKLEQRAREETGIDKIKIGFTAVFGYFLEVPKAQAEKVPDTYIRKQTTANAERYITQELKEQETVVQNANEKAIERERELFDKLRNFVKGEARELQQTADAVAEIDVLAGLAEAAIDHRLCRPQIVEDDVVEYEGGRHLVVEHFQRSFVPNDLSLGSQYRQVILSGPNMSGKSTYLRQTALIVLLAQIGSYVPAKSARLRLCDRIFTRIGARDEIALGHSTFMVEMVESANILNSATSQSLVILDEVGRGTSTFDGLAVAWAMAEHLASLGAKTLFATHYHQLNSLADQKTGIANFRIEVQEHGDEVVWTHKVVPGGADRSYGIHVARLAGLPREVIARAKEVLSDLEASDAERTISPSVANLQMNLFEAEEHPVVDEIRKIDIDNTRPIEALLKLSELKKAVD